MSLEVALIGIPVLAAGYCLRTAFNKKVSGFTRVLGGAAAAIGGGASGFFAIASQGDPTGAGYVFMMLAPALFATVVPAAAYCLGASNEASRHAGMSRDI